MTATPASPDQAPTTAKVVYRIKDWRDHYENNRSREIKRPDWCAIPNKQDGLGYRRLLRRPCGEAAYGCFVACALAASKAQDRDGWLTDDGTENGTPWDAEAISLKTGFGIATVEHMLTYCTSPEIGWITVAQRCGEPAASLRRRDDERTDERTDKHSSSKLPEIIAREIPETVKTPTIEQVTVWARAYGFTDLNQKVNGSTLAEHIAADAKATSTLKWTQLDAKVIKYAIADAASIHERSTPGAPRRASPPWARLKVLQEQLKTLNNKTNHPTDDELAKKTELRAQIKKLEDEIARG